jgi:hypothetical protein
VRTLDEQLVFYRQNACVGKESKHSNKHSYREKLSLLIAQLPEMMIDVFSFVSSIDAGSMEDILKVVIPDFEGEENDMCV